MNKMLQYLFNKYCLYYLQIFSPGKIFSPQKCFIATPLLISNKQKIIFNKRSGSNNQLTGGLFFETSKGDRKLDPLWHMEIDTQSNLKKKKGKNKTK
jgi:hypothetical protein